MMISPEARGKKLTELSILFLRLGITAFGGLAAHIAMLEDDLGRVAMIDIPTIALAVVSAILLLRFRVNSAWLVLGGALFGLTSTAWKVVP